MQREKGAVENKAENIMQRDKQMQKVNRGTRRVNIKDKRRERAKKEREKVKES